MLVKNSSIDETLQRREKKERERERIEDIVIKCACMCMEYDRQLDTFISHDDIR